MSHIELRSDFVRIARAFTYGASGVFTTTSVADPSTATKGIYVEPHPSGKGVLLVSTDRSGLCVQWDQKGSVDRPRLICGLKAPQAHEMSGAVLDDRWLVGTAEKLALRVAGKSRPIPLPGVEAHKCRIEGEPTDEPGVFPYPSWRHMVPSQAEIDQMKDGMPGHFDLAYAAILGRLYSDGAQNCRTVRVKHTPRLGNSVGPNGEPIMLLQFPWRPNMLVVIAPQINVQSSIWHDNLLAPLSEEPVEDVDHKTLVLDKEDPAADL